MQIAESGHPSDASLSHFLFAVCLPMLAMLASVKVVAMWWTWWERDIHFPFRWACLEVGDCLFVAGWALAGAILTGWAGRWPKLRRRMRGAFIFASALVVLYGVANLWIFWAIRMPLTYPLIAMAGSFADVRSSISCYVSVGAVASMIAWPLVYLCLVHAGLRMRLLASTRSRILLAAAASLYCPIGVLGYSHYIVGGHGDVLAGNPHWAFLRSYIAHLAGSADSPIPADGPASYRDDFLTVGDRRAPAIAPATAPATAPGIASPIKNVIVVVLESTGTQFLSVYGSRCHTTPNLEAEAKNALIYRNFYSNDAYTAYSMMPIVLSIYPGNGWTAYASEYPHLSGTSAAQVLHARGFRTAFMTSGTLDYRNDRRFFENRGFDLAEGCEDFTKRGVGTMISSWGMDDAPMFDQMLQWIDAGTPGDAQEHAKPFYLLAWTVQTHQSLPACSQSADATPLRRIDAAGPVAQPLFEQSASGG